MVNIAVRLLVILACAVVTWRSVRHARADLAIAPRTADAFRKSREIEPEDITVQAREVLFKSEAGDDSAAEDQALLAASKLNPFNSELLMTLGLRAEFRGDSTRAEEFLVQATRIDRSFSPWWTLADFYSRNGQPDKVWPLISHCLNLDPLIFDARPIFDLCWRVTQDPRKIAGALPHTHQILVSYLWWLLGTRHLDAAVDLWRSVRGLLRPNEQSDAELGIAYTTVLATSHKVKNALDGWNDLVSSGVVHSGQLNPSAGVSIAEPEFGYPENHSLFSWKIWQENGLYTARSRSGLRAEFDGNEAPTALIATIFAPVRPSRNYQLHWRADGTQLDLQQDPGFTFKVTSFPGQKVTACPPVLVSPGDVCAVPGDPGDELLRIDLTYSRAPGTVRARGTLQIQSVVLEFAP
jgi:tetratricopeptide (TPR) repeat protein